jgi:hypothetical protein
MTSYFVPTKDNLTKQTFLPPETLKDATFDAWLAARAYDFVEKFNTAFRNGETSFVYTYVPPDAGELDGAQNIQLTYLRNTLADDYGYTVSAVERPSGQSTGWQITITLY